MKGRRMMNGLSFINQKYIQEAEFEKPALEKNSRGHSRRRLGFVLLAACLVFTLAGVAYAANAFGLRELLSKSLRPLPEEAYDYIQSETAAAAAEDWSCAITESLSDSSGIMATVTVKGGDKYIVIPTDAMPEDTVGYIGLSGDQTLEELAQAQGKKLLHVGAYISQVGGEETMGASQQMNNISEREMVILTTTAGIIPKSGTEAVCLVYAREAGSKDVQRVELPFSLNRAPTEDTRTYRPVDPDAIPCMHVGEATVTKSALGYTVSFVETVSNKEEYDNMMKTEIVGLTYGEGGSWNNGDGSFTFEVSQCQGTLGDTMTINYYDWDKVYVGTVEFQLVSE